MKLPEIVETYLDAYNRRDVQALSECIGDAVVFENVSNAGSPMTIEGRAAFVELASKSVEMFKDRNMSVSRAVLDGDKVALEIDWVGTPAIDLGPMKAGVEVRLRGASFLTISDGKLSRIVDFS